MIRTRGGVSLSLSLSLSLSFRKKTSVLFWGSKTFALLVSSSCRLQSVGTVVSLFLILKPYTTSSREREKEERVYNCILYYVCM